MPACARCKNLKAEIDHPDRKMARAFDFKTRALLCLLLVAAAAGGCAPDAPPRVQLSPATVVPDRCGLVFWVDGMDIDHFARLLEAGKLPNISRYLTDRGVTVRGAVASLPTITYANNVSFSTALLPGHHGIVGNKWFDRSKLIFQDYGAIKTYQQVDGDFSARNIYEVLGEEFTATILTPVRRGATRKIDNWASAGIAWYFGLHETINELTMLRFELIADLANRTGRWPKFILAYFVTPDTVGHAQGASSQAYTDMLLDIDRRIGQICRSLDNAGVLKRTYVTLVSDHGFVDTPRHFDVARHFSRTLKVATISKRFGREAPLEKRQQHFAAAEAVVVAGGNRRCAIHLRAGEQWWRRPTARQIDAFANSGAGQSPPGSAGPVGAGLPAALAAVPAVELAVVRLGDDSVRVQTAAGVGVIDRVVRSGVKFYRYRVTRGTDPLGYASNAEAAALMDGKHHDADAWLAATLDTPKPDCVVQLVELNDSPRAGDIMLFAADGWDFAPGDRGGHGGLLRHEIVVPWVWAGPGLPRGAAITAARTVDLMPTMLDLIGRPHAIPPGLDGRSIARRLRNARKD